MTIGWGVERGRGQKVMPTNLIADPGFEVPVLAAGSDPGTPAGSGWTWTGTAGISNNTAGAGFLVRIAAFEGTQVAFLQSVTGSGASFSQVVTAPAAGPYVLTFASVQRAGNRQNYTVKIGATVVATIRPPGGAWRTYTINLTLASGANTLTFTALNTDGFNGIGTTDNTALFDSVSLLSGGPGAPASGAVGGLRVNANDSHFVGSPHGFYPIPTTTDIGTNSQGNARRATFTGSTTLAMLFNPPSTAAATDWRIAYRVDDLAWTYAEQNTAIFIDGLDPTLAHIFEFEVCQVERGDIWTSTGAPPVGDFRFQGIQLDANATMLTTDPRPFNVLILGDSYTAGSFARGTVVDAFGYGDSTVAYPRLLRGYLNAEISIRCSPGQGYTTGGQHGWPAVPASFDHWYAGVSMLTAGLFSPAVDLVYLAQGSNDPAAGKTTTDLTTACTTVLNGFIAAGVKAIVHQDCPNNNLAANAAIQASITAVANAKVGPIMPVNVIDYQSIISATPSLQSNGHPTAAFHQNHYAIKVASYILSKGYLSQSPSTGSTTDPGINHVLAPASGGPANYMINGTTLVGTATIPAANTVLSTAPHYGVGGTGTTPSYSLSTNFSDPGAAFVLTGHTYLYAGATMQGSAAVGPASVTAQSGDTYALLTSLLTGNAFNAAVLANVSKSGITLAAAGLDSIQVETGVNARQALSPILAACAGIVSGSGTGIIVIKGGNSQTTRITAITDQVGNRSTVTLTLPA